MTKTIIYIDQNSYFCHQLKKWLQDQHLEYLEKDVGDAVPVVKVDKEIIIGFDPEKLKKILLLDKTTKG
jgi:arsenate reductase-like glutaredoxin family protein